MAFQPAPGVAEVRMNYEAFGQNMVNIFHVKTAADWSTEFLENLGILFREWYAAEIRDTQSTAVTLAKIQVRDLTTEFAGYYEDVPTTSNTGTRTSPALPLGVAAVITWTTGLTGRSTRGRTYHLGVTEDAAIGNELEPVYQAQLQGAYEVLPPLIAAEEVDWVMCVLSRVQGGVPLAEAIGYQITQTAVDAYIDSMRRRLTGRGQ
jgi:hypothetical protein